ncbi:HoxN/HupN/NixA family nickel/cobalt transporter, partial [Klebsiella pneumoniae]
SHALGPGHGKVILSAYIATHPAKLRHSTLLSILASLLQGTVAVVLVSVVLFILNLSVRQLNNVSQITEKASYAFIILFGTIIVIRALRRLFIRPPINK